MAAGFKSATVNAGDVPATQTNFPVFVDLSRVGITTLAEAQSVRVYADSSKTTEWAREIVSVTEMHVKVPSLTSTTSIYVDWDGVRADYAVTDTYGRNATWSEAVNVYHLGADANDSKGDSNGTATSLTYGQSVGSALGADFNGTTSFFNTNKNYTGENISMSICFIPDVVGVTHYLGGQVADIFWGRDHSWRYVVNSTNKVDFQMNTDNGATGQVAAATSTASVSASTFYHSIMTWNGTSKTLKLYLDTAMTSNTSPYVRMKASATYKNIIGKGGNASGNFFNGKIRRFILWSSELSADWVTTEYNNQSDEAGFWGTWSEFNVPSVNFDGTDETRGMLRGGKKIGP